MSAVFSMLETGRNGLHTYQSWLDAIADNVANANVVRPADEEPFRARYIVAEAVDYGSAAEPGIGNGSRVRGVELGPAEGRLVHDPDHPFADEAGMIRYPSIDMGQQLTDMIAAQRAYQANVASVERARTAYQTALQIGRG